MKKSRKKLTILTEPVTFVFLIRNIIYRMIGKDNGYGGHSTRTYRLVKQLERIGYTDFNYRPVRVSDIGENVLVLSSIRTVRYAIKLKKRGIIKRLIVGPNVAPISNQYGDLLASPEIDLYIDSSEWASNANEYYLPKLKGRCVATPYGGIGIDLSEYEIKPIDRGNTVAVYEKSQIDMGIQFTYQVIRLLKKYGYNPILIQYQHYDMDTYKDVLNKSRFMVSIGVAEKSGNYLTEAWAMNTPTICYNCDYYHFYIPNAYSADGKCLEYDTEGVSFAPHLTQYTGTTFGDMKELEDIIQNISEYESTWCPREWVEGHMTYELVAPLFLKSIGID